MREAENLVQAGVKELLVISQDTSAYGVDVKYRTGFWRGRPLKTRMTRSVQALGELGGSAVGAWVRLHYVYPYPHVDEVIPLMAEGKILPYLDVPFQHASPRILQADEAAGERGEGARAHPRLARHLPGHHASAAPSSSAFPGETEAEFEELLEFLEEAELDRVGCFAYSPVEGAAANALPDPVPDEVKEERRARFMQRAAEDQRAQAQGEGRQDAAGARRCTPGRGALRRRCARDRRRGALQGRQGGRVRASHDRARGRARSSRETGMSTRQVVVVGGARTAIGDYGGALKDFAPTKLGAIAIKEAVARAKIDPAAVGHVVIGSVIHGEARDMYLSRVAALDAGLPVGTPCLTVNRLCGSGLQAIVSAAQHILLGDTDPWSAAAPRA